MASLESDPVVSHLLECVGGLLAILDENRQIVAVNKGLLEILGVEDPGDCLGLRPGEAFGCQHAHDMPAGCGTSRWCRSCGAALSIVAALGGQETVERECAMETSSGDLFLRVRCSPLKVGTRRFLSLFLQDITREQRLAMLERVFFHDVNGLVTGVMGYGELLHIRADETTRPMVEALQRVSSRLANEITLQAQLLKGSSTPGVARFTRVRAKSILLELSDEFHQNPVSEGRHITYQGHSQSHRLVTDPGIVIRVLRNMVINALEASEVGEEIRVLFEEGQGQVTFSVWNAGVIPDDVQPRIFQRNFSTKAQLGRGLGTWSMKFFGEDILRGEVGFTSQKGEGTVFSLTLPIHGVPQS